MWAQRQGWKHSTRPFTDEVVLKVAAATLNRCKHTLSHLTIDCCLQSVEHDAW